MGMYRNLDTGTRTAFRQNGYKNELVYVWKDRPEHGLQQSFNGAVLTPRQYMKNTGMQIKYVRDMRTGRFVSY